MIFVFFPKIKYHIQKIKVIDKSLKKVISVKLSKKELIALVEKENKGGKRTKEYIKTTEIKKLNPWVLLEYYESKIRFE